MTGLCNIPSNPIKYKFVKLKKNEVNPHPAMQLSHWFLILNPEPSDNFDNCGGYIP